MPIGGFLPGRRIQRRTRIGHHHLTTVDDREHPVADLAVVLAEELDELCTGLTRGGLVTCRDSKNPTVSQTANVLLVKETLFMMRGRSSRANGDGVVSAFF